MSTGVFGPVQDLLQSALQGLDLRRSVVAQNIANLQTPGYTAQDVTFGATLQQALRTGSVDAQVVNLPGAQTNDGNGVSLEQQLSLLNQIALVEQGIMNGIDTSQKELHTINADLGGPGV